MLDEGSQIGRTQFHESMITSALVLIPAVCPNRKLPKHSWSLLLPPSTPRAHLITEDKEGERPAYCLQGKGQREEKQGTP